MSDYSSEGIQGLNHHSFDISRVFRIIIWISIIIVFVIAILDLVGWKLNIILFKSIMPQWVSMNTITALCLIITATSLTIIQSNLPAFLRKVIPGLLAAFIFLIALITIYVFLYNLKTGNESSLTRIPYLTFFIAAPTRMAFLTACNFIFTGSILFLLTLSKKRISSVVHVILIPVILVSYYIIASYMLGVYSATEVDKISVSLNTGIAFFCISVTILLMRPDTWLLMVFTSTNTGNIIARKLLPWLMILPVVIGWLRINGEQAHLFRSEEGVVLVLITYTFCFLVLVWFTARSVNIIDQKRLLYEEALQETSQRLKYHYENSPLAVVEWNNDFFITQWSLEAERIFGWKKEEVIGKRIDNLNIIYKEDIHIVENVIKRLSDGTEIKVISSNRNYTKKGDLIECIWHNSLMKDEEGKISSVMSLIQDVTILRRTEKELEDSKERYKELVTNARSIIVKLDPNGRFTFANEFAQSFFGYTEEELIGKSVMETILPQKESTGRNLVELVENIFEDPDKFSININENIKKNEERVWIEWYNKALFDSTGKRTGHIAFGVDITKRKRGAIKRTQCH